MSIGLRKYSHSRAALFTAALLTVAVAVPASAQNIWRWAIDDSDNRVSLSAWALTTVTHNSLHDTINYNVGPTDITPSHFHDVTFEITAYDAYYGDFGWEGRAVCLGYENEVCTDGVQVKTNLSYGPYSQLESDSIMCEEVGHALGLDHDFMPPTGSTCMMQSPTVRRWAPHDKSLINGWF